MQTPIEGQTPPPSPAPAPAPEAVVAQGSNAAPVAATASPALVYTGLTNQAKVFREQLERVLDERSEEIAKLTNLSGPDFAEARAAVQARVARLDKRIVEIEGQIAASDAQVAIAAGVPGAIEPYRPPQGGDEAEAFFGGVAFATGVILVITFIRRKFFRRKGKGQQTSNFQIPNELANRMERLENVAEATALEVERIGEGQRFVTKLLSETARPTSQAIERK